MVSTLDFESSDPSSNLGGTLTYSIFSLNDVALHDNNFFGLTKSDCKYYGRSQSIVFFFSLAQGKLKLERESSPSNVDSILLVG